METIGLSARDITNLMATLKIELGKGQEERNRSATAQFISDGCPEDEARFRAGIIGIQSTDMAVVEGIVVANNRRILLDLKEAGLLTP